MTSNIHQLSKKPEHPATEAMPPEYSDELLALRFAHLHAEHLRYVAPWSRWLKWGGTHWVKDVTLEARNLARTVCRAASSECSGLPIGMKVASGKTIAAVETLAKADRHLAATVDQWDADPWLLNTPAGTIDLRTGKSSTHNPVDYCTKIAAVAPGGECPLWLNFLAKIFEGDVELIAFVQRMAGYALTGITREHALFFLYGTGANGKSVLINTIAGMIGEYHRPAPIETFTTSAVDRHPTEVARLCGARLVTASETEEGRRWAESRIKELTGGDPIAARFMRQDHFEYQPQFKLVIAGNHKPGLKSVDEAIRRRFHLIPFNVTIPPVERDLELANKLKQEWPGILAWTIEGCLQWQSAGLKPPKAVQQATTQYFEAEDSFALWLDECCKKNADGWESSSELFACWKNWASSKGEAVGTDKRLAQLLEANGLKRQRKSKGKREFAGIRLLESAKVVSMPGGMGTGG